MLIKVKFHQKKTQSYGFSTPSDELSHSDAIKLATIELRNLYSMNTVTEILSGRPHIAVP
jgi:hypothetical protein